LARAEFQHSIEIAVPRAVLHAFLCDLENYVPLHPLIESIRALPAKPDRPRAKRYRVVDRIPVGPFRMRSVYTAALDPISESEVHGLAWQSPGIHLHTTYALEPAGAGTRLTETCRVDAPWPMLRFVVHQASSSHRTTLEKLKGLLERQAPDCSSQPAIVR
jgi:hypothetical protein